MTARRFILRAAKLSAVVLLLSWISFAVWAWAMEPDIDYYSNGNTRFDNALVMAVVYPYVLVWLPVSPLVGWDPEPGAAWVLATTTLGSIAWGTLMAGVWILLERQLRRWRDGQRSGPSHD